MHRRIGVQLRHLGQQRVFAGRLRQAMLEGVHPRFHRLLALGADIDLAGRILAHQHHRQARRQIMIALQTFDRRRHPAAQALGKGLAVDAGGGNCCVAHGRILLKTTTLTPSVGTEWNRAWLSRPVHFRRPGPQIRLP